MHEYDLTADWYVGNRRSHIGPADVVEFVSGLAPGSRVLDLGCGTGVPITQCLVENGYDVFAIDSSSKMVERFRMSFPAVPVQCAAIQDSDFFGLAFDAVVAWGVWFHLTAADQETGIEKVARALNPGGRFLFTAGDKPVESDWTVVEDVRIPYSSLGADAYSAALRKSGLKLIDRHTDQWENTYYISEKRA
jgi:SAM-dependent methyltransferase